MDERFRPRPSVCFPDRPVRSVRSDTFRPIAAYSFPVRACRANGFCRAIEIRPSTAIPSRLDRNGRPGWKLLGQNSLLRVRGQCLARIVFSHLFLLLSYLKTKKTQKQNKN
ncbi:unnamed protein product [Microthlaspi erraticum]|uniref:Uncharacterized protein n=1 Tax=Microthlaspi erraticum TaxID=1685480 RepID=A0A6D2JRR8_9BRAS|nr:unnamed protein product [Microthlaspi erraticum]